jgi:hypothetical protein
MVDPAAGTLQAGRPERVSYAIRNFDADVPVLRSLRGVRVSEQLQQQAVSLTRKDGSVELRQNGRKPARIGPRGPPRRTAAADPSLGTRDRTSFRGFVLTVPAMVEMACPRQPRCSIASATIASTSRSVAVVPG